MKSLKKTALMLLAGLALAGSLTSCATVFGGKITEHQKRKPGPGEPQRDVRVGALIADILLFWPGAIIDFATGAIYKPLPTSSESPTAAQQPKN